MVLDKFILKDRVVVITGGAGLFGYQHAVAVIEAGGIPVISDVNVDVAREESVALSEKYKNKALGIRMDVTSRESVLEAKKEILNQFGRIDCLINNAALDPKMNDSLDNAWTRFENFSGQVWDKELLVGLKGAFTCSQVFGEHMAENGKGVILNIASDLGIISPDQRIYRRQGLPEEKQPVKPVTYSVIKHGLIGLTRYAATYWAFKGVRVNALCAGGIYNNQPGEFVEKLTNLIPMARMADLDEYQAAVVFLLSDASSYMTGSSLVIDGGRTCW
ncbi:MAG: SDR family oxidoreductase [Candidatus Omnitrophota bacterium]